MMIFLYFTKSTIQLKRHNKCGQVCGAVSATNTAFGNKYGYPIYFTIIGNLSSVSVFFDNK